MHPNNFGLAGDPQINLSLVGDANLNNIVYNIDNAQRSGKLSQLMNMHSILRQKKEELFANVNLVIGPTEDKVYIVWKNGSKCSTFCPGWDTTTTELSSNKCLAVDTNANIDNT